MCMTVFLSTRRIGTVRKGIDNLCLTLKVNNWGDYYERKRFLGLLTYEVPKNEKPEAYKWFIKFVSECACTVTDKSGICFIFHSEYDEKIKQYCSKGHVPFRICERVLIVQHFSANSVEDFLLSGCIGNRRGVEAYVSEVPFNESFLRRKKAKNWFRKYMPYYFRYFFLVDLEKPLFFIWFDKSESESIKAAIAMVGKNLGVEIVNETKQ